MPKSFPEAELEAAAGAAPVERRRVRSGGYGTNSAHWCVELADGRRAFVKVALDDAAAEWLRQEHRVYSAVEAAFIPELVGWHDGEQTLLAIADLSHAHWPPPWTPRQIDAVRAALDELHATPPPPDLPPIAAEREWLNGWELVAEDPEPLLSTGLCSPPWLETALSSLLETGRTCELAGEAFLHLDVRSDNLCLQEGRAVLVDWNLAHVGNPLLDIVAWLPSLKLEGGPDPWELVPDSQGFAALLAGFFASRAGLPPPATAPRVREFQRRQAEIALTWAARELGLPPP
ncbi:MAG TPA: phosphotransferase [Gaiellaceae bacterium]|nr:phosphotransferase [Gaiellaceae bacterium]